MATDLKKIIGQRLQLLRLEKGLTQEQMGEKLNLSTSAYCKIEYGETDLTLTRLGKIAEVLEMSALELFRKIDSDSPAAEEGEDESLSALVRANSLLIDMLCKRVDALEQQVSKIKR